VPDTVDAFMYEQGVLEREAAILRTEKAFKLNPLDILALPTSSTITEVKKKFRDLSLLIHPDKIQPSWRERAQAAFAKLSDAKTALLDDAKRTELIGQIVAARTKILAGKKAVERKRRKDLIRAKTADMELLSAPYPAFESEAGFEALVAAELREVLIEIEWKKRAMMKLAQKEEQKMTQEAEAQRDQKTQRKTQEDNWNAGRTQRISSWRDFQTTASKKKSKKKRKLAASGFGVVTKKKKTKKRKV
jgi:DnaJ family protein C protein 8